MFNPEIDSAEEAFEDILFCLQSALRNIGSCAKSSLPPTVSRNWKARGESLTTEEYMTFRLTHELCRPPQPPPAGAARVLNYSRVGPDLDQKLPL